MILKNRNAITALLCCWVTATAAAQHFNYTAPLDLVSKTGFYQLTVTPELSSHVKTDFSDLRIADEKGNWVPHIIKPALPSVSRAAVTEFPIVSNRLNDSGKTVLVVENKGMGLHMGDKAIRSISEILLYIKNNTVSRYAVLSGSNDQKNWYIINENILLSRNYESDSGYFISSVKFSNADYTYFKLVIDNEKSDPLNILRAGTYFNISFQSVNSLVTNPAAGITQTDSSNGRSYIKVQQNAAFHIDEILVDAAGAKFYKRNAALFLAENDSNATPRNNPEFSFVLASGTSNTFSIRKIKAKIFWLVIENNDNPPLQVKAVSTRQNITRVTAWLEAGKKYVLLAGNEEAVQPDYDLAAFKDSIPLNLPVFSIGAFSKTETPAVAEQKNTHNKWWLWPAIIGSIAILAFLSWKLVADMKKSEA